MEEKHKTYSDILNWKIKETNVGKAVDIFYGDVWLASVNGKPPKVGWSRKPIMPNIFVIDSIVTSDKLLYLEGFIDRKKLLIFGYNALKENLNNL